MVLDYSYLRAAGLSHQQALYKLKLQAYLDDYKREMRGPNRPAVLDGIKSGIAALHTQVKEYQEWSIENVS